jgi:MOSC domain-containing protein YiiM
MSQTGTLQELFDTLPQLGCVQWLGLRPARRESILSPNEVIADTLHGLAGDRYAGSSGKRQVTLIQWEHLAVIASNLGLETLDPALLRRNIAVSGINLLALKGKQFQIGEAQLEYTGLCHPCSFMESTFGPGGYNAVRGHGGITARVMSSGRIALTDSVSLIN